MLSLYRSIVALICMIALVIQAGCIQFPHNLPPPPNETVRAGFGTIGVVSAQYLPKPDFQAPAKGWLAGAGRGAANWAAAGASAPMIAGGGGGGSGGGGIVLVALAATAGTIGGLAGSIAGGAHAEPAEKVSGSETVLKNAIVSLKIQESMRDRFVQVGRSQTREQLVVLPGQGPVSPEVTTDYCSYAEKGIDTVVEIGVTTFGLAGPWDVNPSLTFFIDSQIRVMRTTDGGELYATSLKYRGGERTFCEWAANDAQPFYEELDRAYLALAEKITEELFLVYGSHAHDNGDRRRNKLRKKNNPLPPGTGNQ
jgi:hypothetical protein